jgi:hypothetical protein
MAETLRGSVHESLVRHLPRAPKRNPRKTKFKESGTPPVANFGLRVNDSKLKHRETFSQLLALAPSRIANAAFSLPFASIA